MCQVRLISVPDHTFQFQHFYKLGVANYWDVPSTINKRSWLYLPISTTQRAGIKAFLTHTYPFQHVHWLGITKYLDVNGAINKRSLSYIPIFTCPQVRDKKVLNTKVRIIIVTDHTYQFQHVQRLGIKLYCDVPSMIKKRFWSYLLIST